MRIILLALALAACQPQQPERLAHMVGDGSSDMYHGSDQMAAHIVEHQDLELLYIEKVQPAALAAVKAGLVTDKPQMQAVNAEVRRNLNCALEAVKADDVAKWQPCHDAAYLGMGRMLQLTNAVPVREVTRRPQDVRDSQAIVDRARRGQQRVSDPVQRGY